MLKSLSNTPVWGRVVAFVSLSLVGANFTDYLSEAWRTLKVDGVLHVWEATSRFDDPNTPDDLRPEIRMGSAVSQGSSSRHLISPLMVGGRGFS